jgi:hypothetical protein
VVIYIWTMIFLKLSLGFFYLRVLNHQWQRVMAYTMMSLAIILNVAHFFVAIFSCGNPRHYVQNKMMGHCLEAKWFNLPFLILAIFNVTFNITIMLLPMPSVLRARAMTTRAKMSIIGILMLAMR